MDDALMAFLGREREKTVKVRGEECALHLLSAREAIALRAAVAQRMFSSEEERALYANSALLAKVLLREGQELFPDAEAVTDALGIGEIAALVEQYARFDGRENLSPEDKREQVEGLKKA